jgi:hypothetical protein
MVYQDVARWIGHPKVFAHVGERMLLPRVLGEIEEPGYAPLFDHSIPLSSSFAIIFQFCHFTP